MGRGGYELTPDDIGDNNSNNDQTRVSTTRRGRTTSVGQSELHTPLLLADGVEVGSNNASVYQHDHDPSWLGGGWGRGGWGDQGGGGLLARRGVGRSGSVGGGGWITVEGGKRWGGEDGYDYGGRDGDGVAGGDTRVAILPDAGFLSDVALLSTDEVSILIERHQQQQQQLQQLIPPVRVLGVVVLEIFV